MQRTAASLALSAFVACTVLACFLSWQVIGKPSPAEAQTTGTCPNAQLIDTYVGNGSQQTDTFNTTTNSVRVSYTVTDSDPEFSASLLINVIDATDPDQLSVGGATQEGDGQGETFINSPAGTYFLDILLLGSANYTITVEQCEGGTPSQGVPEASAPPVASSPPSSTPASAPASAPASTPASAPASSPASEPGDASGSAPATEPEGSPDTTSTLEGGNAPGPDAECPGARVVNTASGSGNKQTPVFNVSGDSFRITSTLDTNSPRFLVFDVFVYKEGGRLVTTIGRESPGTDSSIVNAGPGVFYLDILAANTDYFVTVEDCVGVPTEGRGGSFEQPPGRVDSPDDVIQDAPFVTMPPTGGPSIILGALALLGTAVIVGRGVLKR